MYNELYYISHLNNFKNIKNYCNFKITRTTLTGIFTFPPIASTQTTIADASRNIDIGFDETTLRRTRRQFSTFLWEGRRRKDAHRRQSRQLSGFHRSVCLSVHLSVHHFTLCVFLCSLVRSYIKIIFSLFKCAFSTFSICLPHFKRWTVKLSVCPSVCSSAVWAVQCLSVFLSICCPNIDLTIVKVSSCPSTVCR